MRLALDKFGFADPLPYPADLDRDLGDDDGGDDDATVTRTHGLFGHHAAEPAADEADIGCPGASAFPVVVFVLYRIVGSLRRPHASGTALLELEQNRRCVTATVLKGLPVWLGTWHWAGNQNTVSNSHCRPLLDRFAASCT